MAISAINSINLNRVAFKGAQTATKPETKENDDNFFEENKEVLLGLSAVGLAALGAVALHRRGKTDKAAEAVKTTQGFQDATINKMSVEDKRFLSAIHKMQQQDGIASINRTIDEFGPEGTRHAERIASGYEEKLPEIFAEDAKVCSREDVLAWAKLNNAREDMIAWAKVEGLI